MKFKIGSWVQPISPERGLVMKVGQVLAHEAYTDFFGTSVRYHVRFRHHDGSVDEKPIVMDEQELQEFNP